MAFPPTSAHLLLSGSLFCSCNCSIRLICYPITAVSDAVPVVEVSSDQLVLQVSPATDVTVNCSVNDTGAGLGWVRETGGTMKELVGNLQQITGNDSIVLPLTVSFEDLSDDINNQGVNYYCRANNSFGSARSRPLSLQKACKWCSVVMYYSVIISIQFLMGSTAILV